MKQTNGYGVAWEDEETKTWTESITKESHSLPPSQTTAREQWFVGIMRSDLKPMKGSFSVYRGGGSNERKFEGIWRKNGHTQSCYQVNDCDTWQKKLNMGQNLLSVILMQILNNTKHIKEITPASGRCSWEGEIIYQPCPKVISAMAQNTTFKK